LEALPEFDPDWQEAATKSLEDALLILAPDVEMAQFDRIDNIELRRFIVEAHPKFIDKMTSKVISVENENRLLEFNGETFRLWLWLKDASSNKRYLLTVPANMKSVKEAIAWTFNMAVEEYQPIREA
jgi:hypothetical protein